MEIKNVTSTKYKQLVQMAVCLPFRGLVFYFQTGTTPRIFFDTCKGKVQWFTWATHSSIESCELCDPLVGCLWRVRYIHPFLLQILLFIHKLSDFGMLSVSSIFLDWFLFFSYIIFLHLCHVRGVILGAAENHNSQLLIFSVEHHETHLEWRW